MEQDIFAVVKDRLSQNPVYGSSIQRVEMSADGPKQLEIDVVADLGTTEQRRDLGRVLNDIAGEHREKGVEIVFHQYHPDNYNKD